MSLRLLPVFLMRGIPTHYARKPTRGYLGRAGVHIALLYPSMRQLTLYRTLYSAVALCLQYFPPSLAQVTSPPHDVPGGRSVSKGGMGRPLVATNARIKI